MLALAQTNTRDEADVRRIVKQIKRLLNLDMLIPSYHNTITVSCLKAMCHLQATGQCPTDLDFFRNYGRYGNFRKVRIAALRALARLGRDNASVVAELVDVIATEPDPWIALKTAQLVGSSSFPFLANPSQESADICDQLWTILNGRRTSCTPLFRIHALNTYRNIWGRGMPSCYQGSSHQPTVLQQLQEMTPAVDIADLDMRRRRRAEVHGTRKSFEEERGRPTLGQPQPALVASIIDGKIKIARKAGLAGSTSMSSGLSTGPPTPSSTANEEQAEGSDETSPSGTPLVRRLKIKLKGVDV